MSDLVYLFSNFGNTDTSVGEMHAVIRSINNVLVPIDMSHKIENDNIEQGAYLLETRLKNVPKPHASVMVVDPEVGSERHGLAIETEKGFLIGPDNGVLVPAARRFGVRDIRTLSNPKYFNQWYKPVFEGQTSSDIFHGRDVFAAAAAFLKTVPISELGDKLEFKDLVPCYEAAGPVEGGYKGTIRFIDEFGNVFTDIPMENIGRCSRVDASFGSRTLNLPMVKSFVEVSKGEDIICDDSYGFVHFASNTKNFSEKYGIKVGDKVFIKTSSQD